MLQGIVDTIHKAMTVQDRFNEWSPAKRAKAFFEHPHLMDKIISKHRLTCICTDCSAIMDSYHTYSDMPCVVCGSYQIVSEYHC